MHIIETERRDQPKKYKALTFFCILGLFFAAQLNKDNPEVDKIIHAATLAFLGARIFLRSI